MSWLTATILSLLFTVTGTKFTRLRQQQMDSRLKLRLTFKKVPKKKLAKCDQTGKMNETSKPAKCD
jgi:hypothetical protein